MRSRVSSSVTLRAVLVAASCLALCLASWLTGTAAGPTGGWTELASLPVALAQESAVRLPDGRIVVTGGYNSAEKASTKIQLFDPTTNKWSSSTSHLNTGRVIHASAAGHDGKLYIFGGRNSSSNLISQAESYDPVADTINALGDTGCVARAGFVAVTLSDGRIMLIGGIDASDKAVNTIEFFSTETGKCTLAAGGDVMPTARMYLSATLGSDGVVYAIGGYNDSGTLDLVEVYNPATHSWSTGTSMPEPRLRASAVSGPDGKIYVIGGERTGAVVYYKDTLRYDTGAKSWETLPSNLDLPAPRTQLAAVSTASQIVALGGFESGSAVGNLRNNVYALNFDVTPPDTTAPVTNITVDGPHTNGAWFTGAVTVTLSAGDNDGGSGLKATYYSIDNGDRQIYDDAFTIGADGSHTVSFWSMDKADNAETTQSRTINIDGTSPSISTEVKDGNGDTVDPQTGGWYTGPLTISFTCSDDTSGVDPNDPTSCQGTSRLDDGTNQSITVSARDRAGNSASLAIAGINVGDARPIIDYVLRDSNGSQIVPNAAGWFNQSVTVHFRCSPVSGSISSCGPDQTLSEGAGQKVTGTAVDDQGRSRAVTTVAINIDLTGPTYTPELRDSRGRPIVANSAGWFKQAVTVHVDCADALSGVLDCPADETFTDTVAGQFSATIHDAAGNETAVLVGGMNIDSQPPVVTCPKADDSWHGGDLTFTCQTIDEGSNVTVADASFTLTTSVPDGSETDQAATDSRTVCDLAENCAVPVQITGVRIDKQAPGLQIDSPAGSYPQGAIVTASYHCDDGGSGIASCSGTVANDSSVDTSTPGEHSFSLTAVDRVGHQTSQTIIYTVLDAPGDPGGDNPGDGDPPPTTDASRYQVQALYDQDKAVTRGYWVMIRVALWDVRANTPAAPRSRINAIDVAPAGATFKAPGNLNTRFQYSRQIGDHGGYQLSLNTRKLTPGKYILRFIVEGDTVIHEVAFRVR